MVKGIEARYILRTYPRCGGFKFCTPHLHPPLIWSFCEARKTTDEAFKCDEMWFYKQLKSCDNYCIAK